MVTSPSVPTGGVEEDRDRRVPDDWNRDMGPGGELQGAAQGTGRGDNYLEPGHQGGQAFGCRHLRVSDHGTSWLRSRGSTPRRR